MKKERLKSNKYRKLLYKESAKFTEHFTNECVYAKYGSGDYYMKITMNRLNTSREVEWIPFNVSM